MSDRPLARYSFHLIGDVIGISKSVGLWRMLERRKPARDPP